MSGKLPNLPHRTWIEMTIWALASTFLTIILAVVAAAFLLNSAYADLDAVPVAVAFVIPVLVNPAIIFAWGIHHHRLKQDNEKLQRLAYQDTLVGCLNRRGFTASVDIGLQYASERRPCALLIIDADKFKCINDTYGHDKGDEALVVITQAIKSAIRSSDMLGRIGGEEFGVFLPGTDEPQAREIAQRICCAVASALFEPQGDTHRLSVSVGGGVATKPITFSALFRNADKCLYAAKHSGGNRANLKLVVSDGIVSAA